MKKDFYEILGVSKNATEQEIKKAGFNNSYEVLNELYKKMNIGTLSEEMIQEGLEYDFIHIEFYSEPTAEEKKFFKRSIKNFLIFFSRPRARNFSA